MSWAEIIGVLVGPGKRRFEEVGRMTPRQGKLLLAALFPPKDDGKAKPKPKPKTREESLTQRFGSIQLPE